MQEFPKILLIDMNSFFASVEQQANPFLRGKPVGVVASMHETSCLIATSKEAKKLGIKTGTLIYKAKKICPKIVLLKAEPEKYREVNRRIVKIFYDYTDRVEVYSIDEAFLDLSPENNRICEEVRSNDRTTKQSNLRDRSPRGLTSARECANSLAVGAEIKWRIRQEVGEWLTCSVGVAPNKFMAKLACDLQKPDGLAIVWRENLPEIYKHKRLRDLWGIARGWENRLAQLGITSPLQLLGYPVQNLISLFGKPGYYIWERVNGLERDVIAAFCHSERSEESISMDQILRSAQDDTQKSFGHSWVLNFRTTDKERLKPVILRLAEKAARRMRNEGFQAYGFYLSIKLVDARLDSPSSARRGSYFAKSKKLKFAINTGLELYEQAMMILEPPPIRSHFDADVMHIAVGFRELVEYSRQLTIPDLIRDPSQARSPLSRGWVEAVDQLNDKYGEFTVRSGLLTHTQDYAPDAIAFGK